MRWDDLRVLLAVARAGRLREAGVKLGVNASTVSRRLEALEHAMGIPLFDRTASGLAPTAALEAVLPHAEAVEGAVAALTRTVAGYEAEAVGTVRITAPPGLAEHFLAAAIRGLVQRHPEIRVELDGSIAYSDLTRREADIALRSRRPDRGDLIAVKVGTSRDDLFGAPEYVAALGALRSLNDARWIQWDRDLAAFSSAQWLEAQVDPASIVLRTSRIGAQVEAARTGLGLVLLPRIYAGVVGLVPASLTPRLRKSLPTLPEHALWLVGHRALRHVPRIAAVWDFLLERLRTKTGGEIG